MSKYLKTSFSVLEVIMPMQYMLCSSYVWESAGYFSILIGMRGIGTICLLMILLLINSEKFTLAWSEFCFTLKLWCFTLKRVKFAQKVNFPSIFTILECSPPLFIYCSRGTLFWPPDLPHFFFFFFFLEILVPIDGSYFSYSSWNFAFQNWVFSKK